MADDIEGYIYAAQTAEGFSTLTAENYWYVGVEADDRCVHPIPPEEMVLLTIGWSNKPEYAFPAICYSDGSLDITGPVILL